MKNNLKQIRKIKGVTQMQLAKHLGVSRAVISMWESNPNEKIPLERVKQIALFLNIDEELITADDIDFGAIERESIKEEIEHLSQRYAEVAEMKQIQLNELIETHHRSIDKELQNMLNEPDKLKMVERFSKIINDFDIDIAFHHVQPYALTSLVNGVFKLIEDKDPVKINLLLSFLQYLNELDKEKNYKWDGEESLATNIDLLNSLNVLIEKFNFKKFRGKNHGTSNKTFTQTTEL